MKKKIMNFVFVVSSVVSAIFLLSACSSDASIENYVVNYDYGIAKEAFVDIKESSEVKPNESIVDLPKITEKYKDAFVGWFIKDTNISFKENDLINKDVTLEAKFDIEKMPSGLYQYGKSITPWQNIKDAYSSAFYKDNQICGSGYFDTDKSYLTNLKGILVIDAEIQTIETVAFKDCLGLTNVVLPNGLIKIGNGAFTNCNKLSQINIPKSVAYIGEEAFKDCSSLNKVIFNDNVISIKDAAFENCTNLVEVNLPNGLETISNDMFNGCSNLQSVFIPKSVNSIGLRAFRNCTSLSGLLIPERVNSIGVLMCGGCSNLYQITVDINNKNYSSIDGDLYDKEGSTLLQVAQGKCGDNFLREYVVPDSVTRIGDWAFDGCLKVWRIHLSKNVNSIPETAFDNCPNLRYFGIAYGNPYYSYENHALYRKKDDCLVRYCPGNEDDTWAVASWADEIGLYAFNDCKNLKNLIIPISVVGIYNELDFLENIFYKGSETEWANVSYIHSLDANIDSLVRLYSETRPTFNINNYWHYDIDGVTPILWE